MAEPFSPYNASDPIQPLGLAGPGAVPVPNIETRTEEQYFQDVTTPTETRPINPIARDAFPVVDEFAKYPVAAPDDFSKFPVVDEFSKFPVADDFDVSSVDELDKNREGFDPVTYFASNPDAANDPVKLKKLLDVYRKRREEGLTAGGVIKAAIKETPGLVGNILGGVKRLGERAIDVTVQPVANVVLGTLTGDMFDDKKRAALFTETRKVIRKGVSEVSAGSEAAAVGLVDLSRTGLRKLDPASLQPGNRLPPGRFNPPTGHAQTLKPKTDQELLRDISDDASFRQNAAEILAGQGEAAKNFGLDKETLAKEGITLDEKAIEQLSLVDPITMLATGGAFKLVGVGGKVLGTARSLEGAQKIADKLASVVKYSAGKAVQGTGKAISGTGTLLKGTGTGAATIAGISSAVSGGGIPQSLIVGGVVKAVGPAMREGGKKLAHFGRAIAGEVPVSAAAQKVLDYAIKPTVGVAETVGRGAFTGIVAGSPFAIAADTDEQAGALLGAGAALGAAGAAGVGAFRVVKNSAARRYFGENRPVLPDVPSPGYGDAVLDPLHEAQIQKLSAQDVSEVNNFREILRPLGKKIYSVDRSTFRQKVSETMPDVTPEQLDVYENHSAFFDSADTVYLNSDATGLQHDAGHLFDSLLTPEKRTELRKAVTDAFGQKSIEDFKATYEQRVGSKISDVAALDEFIAEQFSALFNNVPVTELNAPKSLLNKFIDVMAEGAEVLGVDIGKGVTTPSLGAPVSVGIRKLFQNAAGEVTRRNVEGGGPAPTNVEPLPPTPPPAPPGAGPVAPPTNVVPLTPPPANVVPLTPPPANVVPLPTGRSIRVTPEQVAAFKQQANPTVRALADADSKVTGVEYARAEAKKNEGSPTSQIIERISDSMESGRPVVGIEHLGITSASTPAAPAGRTPRRGEQAAGYAALEAAQLDVRQNAPPEIVAQHSKNFVPVRWTDQGGTPTLIAMSLDKVISNILKIVADPKAKDLIPYPVENGKLTAEGWREVVADAQAYSENQANGRKGDGGRIEVPEAGLSIPAENPAYIPKPLSPERANFQNLTQGISPPKTSRETVGEIPGNVKGQLLAEANRRPVEIPANIPVKQSGKQAFVSFPPRVIQEVNPLRNAMEARGVKTRELLEVTERIRAKDIVSATPKPEINYKAPVTDTIRGGFLPKELEIKVTPEDIRDYWNFRDDEGRVQRMLDRMTDEEFAQFQKDEKASTVHAPGHFLPAPTEFRQKNLGGRTVEEFSDYILKASPDEWKAATDNMTGGLTGGAWNLGLGLKDAADVGVLKSYADKFSDSAKAAMKAGEFDSAMSQVSRGQFFREAYEAATGTGSAGAAFKRGTAGMESAIPPFPIEATTESTSAGGAGTTEAAKFQPAEQKLASEPKNSRLKTLLNQWGVTHLASDLLQEIQNGAGSLYSYMTDEGYGKNPVQYFHEKGPIQFPSGEVPPASPTGGSAQIIPLPDRSKVVLTEADRNRFDEQLKTLSALLGIQSGEPANMVKFPTTPIQDVRKARALFQNILNEALGREAKAPAKDKVVTPKFLPAEELVWPELPEELRIVPTPASAGGTPPIEPPGSGAIPPPVAAGRFQPAEELQPEETPELKVVPAVGADGTPTTEPTTVDFIPPPVAAGAFQPRTESGRKLEEKGFEIVETGEMGSRRVSILDKDKETIAQIQSVQLSPKKAEIAFVSKKKGAPTGLGEVLYREVGSRLRDDGVRSLEGQVIAPEPLVIRKKIFGGFEKLTTKGKPVTYEQALATTEQPKRGTRYVPGIETVNKITEVTKFLPKRDAQGRPLDKEGNINYAKWQAEGIAARKKQRAESDKTPPIKEVGPLVEETEPTRVTGWILPDKTFVQLDTNFHEQFLAQNAADLNKKFGTKFSTDESSGDDRLVALNAGFVRFRNYNGRLSVEANSFKWPSLKRKVLETIQDREGQIDSLIISLLNTKGQQVDSTFAPRLHELPVLERLAAIEEAVNTVRPGPSQ